MLICTSRTLFSAGTERMLVDFGKAGLIDKARQQPDKVDMVLDKIRTDGLMPTLEAVRNKLDQPLPMGYGHAGLARVMYILIHQNFALDAPCHAPHADLSG